ncbi:glycosyltransferase family 4 protein [Chromobacterium violaceum]|uniref:glycosyltransferase family 4 protein n=1 Tax=Chromobacterium violaceum TaxID=536 RepID=UPI0035A73CFE
MSRPLKIALIADTFPPFRTSSAVQLRDLSREFVRQGYELTVMVPAADLTEPWRVELVDGVRVLRLKAPRIKDINYVRRTIGESIMPFVMLRHLRGSPLANEKWDGVVWYAPSIFLGPVANALKRSSRCKGYLIIRDIFPEWAVDMGLMGRGLPYWFFSAVARYQYSVADVIGVQTPGNESYFDDWLKLPKRKLEVLPNWLGKAVYMPCSIQVSKTRLAGRKIFVYAGNMGVAQGMDVLLDLAEQLHDRLDVGFLFVGRGSEAVRLKATAHVRQLDNVLFFDEIDPDEIPNLYAQCSAGIVALDRRHKSHNIPGKFLTYMQSGLPVLANINAGNDLAKMIRDEQVGQVCESQQVSELVELTSKLLEQIESGVDFTGRCRSLFQREFAVEKTVSQIMTALSA